MKKILDTVKKVPWWGYAFGFFYFGLQYGMYRLGDLLSRVFGTIAYAWLPKIDCIDDAIPLFPYVFAVIYLYSYIFWMMGPMAVSLSSRKNFINYLVGLSLAYIVGFLIFVFAPTYMDRVAENLMEQSQKPGFSYWLLSVIYGADGDSFGFNLFPSYHCLISTYCYLGVRKQPEISKGFRIYSLVMTVLISLSTVFTKQHYFIDIVGGVGISILCYLLVSKLNPAEKYFSQYLPAPPPQKELLPK